MAETRFGPDFSGLFVCVLIPRVEERRFSPRIRAASRSMSRRRNLVVRASPTCSPNSWLERRTQKKRTGRFGIELVAQILFLAVLTRTRDFAAARSNRAAIACHPGVCARSVRADAFRRGLRGQCQAPIA